MERPDLAAVLDHYDIEYVSGRNSQVIRCPSPDHEDFVKSCSIDLNEGVLNCFGCSFAGSSLDLIMIVEGVDIRGAIDRGATFLSGTSNRDVREELGFGKRLPKGPGFTPRYRNSPPPRRGRRPDVGS